MQGLIGKKMGMTQVFDETGRRDAVTVIEAGPCVVVQRKTKARDGYEAVQLGFQEQKEHRMTKAALARFKAVGSTPRRVLAEFSVDDGDDLKEGQAITAAMFEGTGFVDVAGVTKGRAFRASCEGTTWREAP